MLLCARCRRAVRSVFQPGRHRSQSRVWRHAHRQSCAWRLSDAGRIRRFRRSASGRARSAVRYSPRVCAVLLAGLLLYWVLVPRLQRARDPEMLSFILFFGLSQVIEALTTIVFGTSERSIQSRAAWHGLLDRQGQAVRRQAGRRRPVPDLRPGISGLLGGRGRTSVIAIGWSMCISIARGWVR